MQLGFTNVLRDVPSDLVSWACGRNPGTGVRAFRCHALSTTPPDGRLVLNWRDARFMTRATLMLSVLR